MAIYLIGSLDTSDTVRQACGSSLAIGSTGSITRRPSVKEKLDSIKRHYYVVLLQAMFRGTLARRLHKIRLVAMQRASTTHGANSAYSEEVRRENSAEYKVSLLFSRF